MQVSISRQDPATAAVDGLIIAIARSERLPRAYRALDAALRGQLSAYLTSETFQGKTNERAELPGEGVGARTVVLLGLGDDGKLTAEGVRRAVGGAVRTLGKRRWTRLGLVLPGLRRPGAKEVGQALAEGALLGSYRFDKYRTGESLPGVERLDVFPLESRHATGLRAGARDGVVIGESTNFARDLANEPGSVHTPAWLAQQSRAMAKQVGLKSKIFTERELERQGMGGILAVGRGAACPPRLITLEHGEPGPRRPTVALVGKGVTFDTGGISIKPAGNMDAMKGDMSGGAAVIGAMRAAALLKVPLHVVGIVGAAMNMPDGEAYVPGDIVHTAAGKTIEVLNTDAEGRIVLADALHHATGFEPDAIIDIATLTGAKVIALGSACCAVMGNDEKLISKLRTSGDRTHERAWPLPLWDEHKAKVKGVVGDLKNTGGREGGSITAAALLAEFVGETSWAHLDIAGNERTESSGGYYVKGATGFGVRLFVDLLRNWR